MMNITKWFKKNEKQLSPKEEILALYSSRKWDKSRELGHKLDKVCQSNLDAVADIVFDNSIEENVKERILFFYSTPINSTFIEHHPRCWVNMLTKLIAPRMDELPEEMKHTLKWMLDMWKREREKSIPGASYAMREMNNK